MRRIRNHFTHLQSLNLVFQTRYKLDLLFSRLHTLSQPFELLLDTNYPRLTDV